MSLGFKSIVDQVLQDGFSESKRASAKEWVRFRHSWLWNLEQWTFRYATSSVTFASNTPTVADVPTDFKIALVLYGGQGQRIRAVPDMRTFFDGFNQNLSNGSGSPEAFTVVGDSILVGPNGDGTTGFLVYEKKQPTLTDDDDETGLPDGFDLALVHGGKAEGFKLANVPLWQGFDDDFTAAANAMRRDYLVGIRGAFQQFGSWTP